MPAVLRVPRPPDMQGFAAIEERFSAANAAQNAMLPRTQPGFRPSSTDAAPVHSSRPRTAPSPNGSGFGAPHLPLGQNEHTPRADVHRICRGAGATVSFHTTSHILHGALVLRRGLSQRWRTRQRQRRHGVEGRRQSQQLCCRHSCQRCSFGASAWCFRNLRRPLCERAPEWGTAKPLL